MDIVIPAAVQQSLGTADAPPVAGTPSASEQVAAAAKPEPKAPAPKAEPAEAPKPERKVWKIKADGEEFDFDATDEQAVKNEIAKARGAHKRFEAAAAMRKEAETFYDMLRTNPKAVLADPRFGHDVQQLAQEIVWEQMQDEALTPAQKHQRAVDAELKRYRDQEQATKQAADQAQLQALQEHYETNYEEKIVAALDLGGVPQSKAAVRRMGHYMQKALEHGIDLEPADLVRQVRKDLEAEHRELFSTADAATLRRFLGEDGQRRLREDDVRAVRSTQPEAHRKPANRPSTRQSETRKLSGDEWREDLARRLGSK